MKGATNIVYKGIPLEVDYDFTPQRDGKWNLNDGSPGYPDEPAELDVENVYVIDSNIYDLLSEETISEINDLVFNKVQYE
jgi:hypothetical protein